MVWGTKLIAVWSLGSLEREEEGAVCEGAPEIAVAVVDWEKEVPGKEPESDEVAGAELDICGRAGDVGVKLWREETAGGEFEELERAWVE